MNPDRTPPWRCSDTSRERGDDVAASAPPASRLLLVEVPGPWGRTALTESRLDHYVAGRLAEAAGHAGVRVLLVRRPGRHASGNGDEPVGRAWALADVRPGREAVTWGTWARPRALMEVDLRAAVVPSGPQRVALVCTHARHDVCCAVRGRPVAAAVAAGTDWDVWECSHVGGDRFAANLLLLPSGHLFGRLDPAGAVDAVRRYDAGRVTPEHWRGRYGRSPVEQAALSQAAVALGDDRVDAIRVLTVEERPGETWTVDVAHRDGVDVVQHYRLRLVASLTRPHLLTCAAVAPSRARFFELDGPPEALLSG